MKIDRLQLINASARYQLLSANAQLLDFHLSRIMQQKKLNKQNSGAMRRKGTVLRESSQNRENAKTGDTQNIQLNTIAEEYHKESKSDRPIEGLDHKSSMHTIEPTSAKKDKLEERGPKPLNIVKQQKIDEVDAYDQDPTGDLPS